MAPKAPREHKRKAGGEGKKGKKFLENKEGLLSLIGDVTESKESIRQSKLDKLRSYQGEAAPPGSGSNLVKKKEVTPTEKRKREKDRALAEAKAALAAKAKEKKQRSKAPAAPSSTSTSSKAGKKRVGFA